MFDYWVEIKWENEIGTTRGERVSVVPASWIKRVD